MANIKSPYAPGVEKNFSLNQHQVIRFGVGYAQNEVARRISHLPTAHLSAAENVLRCILDRHDEF